MCGVESLGRQHGAQAGAAGCGSPMPCAHSLRWCRRTEVVRVIVTVVAEEKGS